MTQRNCSIVLLCSVFTLVYSRLEFSSLNFLRYERPISNAFKYSSWIRAGMVFKKEGEPEVERKKALLCRTKKSFQFT